MQNESINTSNTINTSNRSNTTNTTNTTDVDLHKFIKCDVFTPENICEIMASKLHDSGTLLEPSIGTGNLLKYINTQNYTIDAYEIKDTYLKELPKINMNINHEDFIKANIQKSYRNIIMNPPYIKMQDLSENYRSYIKSNFPMLKTGLVDIYYAFIIKCLSLLDGDGIMVAITPNSFLYNKSSHNLRKYLFENQYVDEIIDFQEQKVFPSVSVYCCISVFSKSKKEFILYNQKPISYKDINQNYSLFNIPNTPNTHGNDKNFVNTNNESNITTLKDVCKITNGIATLRDKIYIHNTQFNNEPCWKIVTNGHEDKYIIYPYFNGKIINEKDFKTNNPETYTYLENNKEELQKRDKGKKKYPEWYAYGRSQSILYSTKTCIYISSFLDPNKISKYLYTKKGTLHHNCLCIEPKNEDDIPDIIDAIKNNIQYISNNSAKRSAGWINISSRILYEVPFVKIYK